MGRAWLALALSLFVALVSLVTYPFFFWMASAALLPLSAGSLLLSRRALRATEGKIVAGVSFAFSLVACVTHVGTLALMLGMVTLDAFGLLNR